MMTMVVVLVYLRYDTNAQREVPAIITAVSCGLLRERLVVAVYVVGWQAVLPQREKAAR